MDYNIILTIVATTWLFIEIKPIQHFLLMRNWGWLGIVLTCWKCCSLWTGLIVCLVLYIVNGTILNPVNAIMASFIAYILDKIINYYERN